MTQLFFAVNGNPEVMRATFDTWDWQQRPLNILAAFPDFVKVWHSVNQNWPTKATMLDSGAYSAFNSGKVIDFDKLCEEARNPCWTEVVALDVVGNGEASLANALEMRRRGLTVMPVFHYSEPWDILLEYKKEFGRLGLGGRPQDLQLHYRWLDQCFARVYPAKIHRFGCGNKDILLRYPFWSADTASWHSPVAFGHSKAVPGMRLPRKSELGGSVYNLKAEVLKFLEIEAEVQDRWRNELAKQFPEG